MISLSAVVSKLKTRCLVTSDTNLVARSPSHSHQMLAKRSPADFRLVALVQYKAGVLFIRFFGSHEEHDGIDAETV